MKCENFCGTCKYWRIPKPEEIIPELVECLPPSHLTRDDMAETAIMQDCAKNRFIGMKHCCLGMCDMFHEEMFTDEIGCEDREENKYECY